jgi:hypothetical protein
MPGGLLLLLLLLAPTARFDYQLQVKTSEDGYPALGELEGGGTCRWFVALQHREVGLLQCMCRICTAVGAGVGE